MKRLLGLVLTLAVTAASLCGCAGKAQDKTDNSKYAMYSENFNVTKGMISYFFNAQYLTFLNGYSDYLENLGLDTSKSLAEQSCKMDTSKASWYDYFMDQAKEKLEDCLTISEKANEDSVTLSKKEKQAAEAEFDALKAAAKEEDLSFKDYIAKNFGEIVTESDIKACLNYEHLAKKYYNKFVKKLDTSTDALQKYFDGHRKTYCTVDYLCFNVPAKSTSSTDMTDARKIAVSIGESKDKETFLRNMTDYITNYYVDNYSNIKASVIKEKINEAKSNCLITDAAYDGSSAASRWAFSEDRAAYDYTVLENKTSGGYDVYYIVSPPKRQEYCTADIRQIVISPDDKISAKEQEKRATQCLSELKGGGFKAAKWQEVAAEYGNDETLNNGGRLIEGLKKGNIKNATELESWIFDESRKVGDSTVIKTSEYGWHIVYIEKIGEPVWLSDVRSGYCNSKFEAYVSDLGDNYVIHLNNNIICQISETDQSNFKSAA